jgi:hypothetical protein
MLAELREKSLTSVLLGDKIQHVKQLQNDNKIANKIF